MTPTKTASAAGPPPGTPIAVWPSAQETAKHQRCKRYVPESKQHPAKMLPDLARRIIEEYSAPGDLVVDPMAGSGTTLVEAALLDRRSIGVELDTRWIKLATANFDHALDTNQRLSTSITQGDARQLNALLETDAGSVDLIVTSPPYACDIATIDKPAWLAGGSLEASGTRNYSADRANLGHARGTKHSAAMTEVYAACFRALRPGGLMVTVTKNMRQRNALVDLAGMTTSLAREVGFTYLQHVISLLCGVRDGELVGRPSLWQIRHLTAAHRKGIPVNLVAHEDVLVFRADKAGADV